MLIMRWDSLFFLWGAVRGADFCEHGDILSKKLEITAPLWMGDRIQSRPALCMPEWLRRLCLR